MNRLGNLEEAKKCFEQSLERAKQDAEHEASQGESHFVTTTYNLGRIYEGLYMFEKAEKNYKLILTGLCLNMDFISCASFVTMQLDQQIIQITWIATCGLVVWPEIADRSTKLPIGSKKHCRSTTSILTPGLLLVTSTWPSKSGALARRSLSVSSR